MTKLVEIEDTSKYLMMNGPPVVEAQNRFARSLRATCNTVVTDYLVLNFAIHNATGIDGAILLLSQQFGFSQDRCYHWDRHDTLYWFASAGPEGRSWRCGRPYRVAGV